MTLGLITGDELHELVTGGVIEAPHEAVGPSSIDVTIAPIILMERPHPNTQRVVTLGQPSDEAFMRVDLEYGLPIRPGAFFLGSINEHLHLPDDISAQFHLRSSVARSGIEHLMAGWIDPGFEGELTLELTNAFTYRSVVIPPHFAIGQITFLRHDAVSDEQSYRTRGRYNGQRGPTPAR